MFEIGEYVRAISGLAVYKVVNVNFIESIRVVDYKNEEFVFSYQNLVYANTDQTIEFRKKVRDYEKSLLPDFGDLVECTTISAKTIVERSLDNKYLLAWKYKGIKNKWVCTGSFENSDMYTVIDPNGKIFYLPIKDCKLIKKSDK